MTTSVRIGFADACLSLIQWPVSRPLDILGQSGGWEGARTPPGREGRAGLGWIVLICTNDAIGGFCRAGKQWFAFVLIWKRETKGEHWMCVGTSEARKRKWRGWVRGGLVLAEEEW